MRQILGGCLLAFLMLIGGCANRQHFQLQDLPLPATNKTSGCCWQAMQRLQIRYRGETFDLNAALARTPEGASLVLLDPLGRRLFSVRQLPDHQHGTGLETWRSPEFPRSLPERFLLASSLLVWWPENDWAHLRGSDWSLVTTGNTRELYFRGQPILIATYSDGDTARTGMHFSARAQGETVELQHRKIPLHITVITLHKGAL